MKKSKETIKQSLRLIFIVVLILWFLESNRWGEVRAFVASNFSFFQGKREIFSNIFIGILGSAVLLAFGEIINYFQEKRRLELRILELYQTWDKQIKHKDEIIADNVSYLKCIEPEMMSFWKEVSLIYNEYLPYMRVGQYFKLIRSMFQYVNEIKVYLDKVEYIKNEKKYLLKSIEYYETLRSGYLDTEINNKINICIESWRKQLEILECEKLNEEKVVRKINKMRTSVSVNATTANVLFLDRNWKSIEAQDERFEFETSMYEIRKLSKQAGRQQLGYKVKKLSPKSLWEESRIKWLTRKYGNK